MNNSTIVILPKWIWEDASTNDEFKQNLSKYMNKNYADYKIISIEKYQARCERS